MIFSKIIRALVLIVCVPLTDFLISVVVAESDVIWRSLANCSLTHPYRGWFCAENILSHNFIMFACFILQHGNSVASSLPPSSTTHFSASPPQTRAAPAFIHPSNQPSNRPAYDLDGLDARVMPAGEYEGSVGCQINKNI
jgi:hypothetical protein